MTYPTGRLAQPGESYLYSRSVADVDDGKVEEVTLRGPRIFGRFKDKRGFKTLAPHTQILRALTDRLLANKVTVMARPEEDDPTAISILAAWTPNLIWYLGVWLFMTRPLLALIRQLEASIKAAHHTTDERPVQD